MRVDRLVRLFRKLRGRSARELVERVGQATSVLVERTGISRDMSPLSERGLVRSVRADLRHTAGHISEAVLSDWLEQSPLLPAWYDLDLQELKRTAPDHVREVLARADCVRAGRADLLGYDQLDVGSPPDWHRDAVSGMRAPLLHWSQVPFLDSSIVGDHKAIWELNRQQGAVALAQAFRLTDQSAYAHDAWAIIDDWIEQNPPKLGINWASSLELAFRIVAWTWCANLLRPQAPSPRLFARLLDVLARHGRHIERHLSNWFAPNTHLTGEALGLYCLGAAWPQLADASRWRDLGEAILRDEFTRQIHRDGVYYERTAWYHRYVVDFLLVAHEIARSLCRPDAAREFASHLAQCGGALSTLMAPSGDLPLLGDDDGGLLLVLGRRPTADARPSLHAAAAILGRSEWTRQMPSTVPETVWLLGSARAGVNSSEDSSPAPVSVTSLEDGGWHLLAGPNEYSHTVAIMDAGQLGPRRTGRVHSHASSLALEVRVLGEPMLTDRGTGSYSDANLRNALRRAHSHNTVTIDDKGASEPSGAFGWDEIAEVRVLRIDEGSQWPSVSAEARGFGSSKAVHQRATLCLPGYGWIVRDAIVAAGKHQMTAHWHASPEAEVGLVLPHVARVSRGEAHLQIHVSEGQSLRIEEAIHSPIYGRVIEAQEVQYSAEFVDSTSWVTILAYRDHDSARIQHSAHGWNVRLGSITVHVAANAAGDVFTISQEP